MQDGWGRGQRELPLVAESYEIVPGRSMVLPFGARGLCQDGHVSEAPSLILLCDHAGNAFPDGYGTLGLAAGDLQRHIAYDIGAAGVVRAMAARLGAPAVLSRYSRLLIDLNRGADDPTQIMFLSDGAIIPGNYPLSEAERDKRVRQFYEPYHQAVDAVIERQWRFGPPPVIVSLHSFTDTWKGVARPWHVGILWDRDDRLPSRMLSRLRADPQLVVGDNQPYRGQLEGDCMNRHATAQGLAHALIEVRQDLIATPAGQLAWANRLCAVLEGIMADPQAVADLAPAGRWQATGLAQPAGPLQPGGRQAHMLVTEGARCEI